MKLLLLLFSIVILGACSTTSNSPTATAEANGEDPNAINIVDVCEDKSVHEIGVTDALNNKKMNAAFLAACDQSKRLTLRRAYKTGYKQGLAQKKQTNRSISGK